MSHQLKSETSGTGDPLVLLPGSLTGWLSWTPHAEILATSRKIIRLQLRCVELGLTGAPLPSDYAVDDEINSMYKTLDELEILSADMAGWSYGGAIALSYALHHPERVRSLTLIEPPAFWVLRSRGPLSSQILEEQEVMQKFAVADVSEEQLIAFLRMVRVVPPHIDPRNMPQWREWVQHRQSLRIGDAPFRHEDNIERVRAFKKPVLLVKGEGSSPFLHDIIDVLAEELPDARVVTFPAGHAPHLVSMQPFLDRFTAFLSQI